MLCKSFSPIINKNCRILILGSMPGVKSLTEQEYYAHPKNRFWILMQKLLANKVTDLTYSQKKQLLLRNKIALWDTLAYCEREGSLDSDILAEQPNDLVSFLQQYSCIEIIICNGGKAAATFKKYFAKDISPSTKVYYLPSTSPANARMSLNDLVKVWGQVINQKIKFEIAKSMVKE